MSGNCCRAHRSPSNCPALTRSDMSVLQEAKPFCRRLQIKIPNTTFLLCRTSQKPKPQSVSRLGMKKDADKNILLKATLDTGAQGNKLPMSFYRQMCPQNLDDHDLKPGSYYPRILPSLPTTARRSRTTVPLYDAILYYESILFCRTVSWSWHFVITLVHSVINLKWMVDGQVNPTISIIIDNSNSNESNDNSNCLLLLLLRMFWDNYKNLYEHMTNLHSTIIN